MYHRQPAPQQSRSPPPLHHPIPTHPHYAIPDPPTTPLDGPSPPHPAQQGQGQQGPGQQGGYMRYTSSPMQPQAGFSPPPAYGGQPGQYQPLGGAMGSMGMGAPRVGPQMGSIGAQGMAGMGIPPTQQQGLQGMQMWGVNDATAAMGMQFGQSAMRAGQDYIDKNLSIHLPLPLIRHQFNVSNSYVLHKLRLLVFPWRHRPWARTPKRSDTGAQADGWQPPREDVNSPDLYIPTMALVTYILLSALQTGLQSRFHPEVLGITASKALAVLLIEYLSIQLGCYLLNIQGQGQVMDLVAYGGYKFVGVICTMLVGLLNLGRTVYWLTFIYAFAATAFFLLRSLRQVVLPDPSVSPSNVTVTSAQRGRRIQFLFIIAVSQLLYMWILAWV
ncbi:YIF1-domain-containing protein [Calocera viscosa TUFC12733]|uniref:Protein YIF1 n=1 Tax=Calocera viscosa (strain TUFC12733) TaxID=1330018 RepID=A0A167NB43_CALVF|nr:YIF1-domain-containing protein [Calocera viscosa TUFC12733]